MIIKQTIQAYDNVNKCVKHEKHLIGFSLSQLLNKSLSKSTMNNTHPFNSRIYIFLAIIGFFPFSTKKFFKGIYCCTVFSISFIFFILLSLLNEEFQIKLHGALVMQTFLVECEFLNRKDKLKNFIPTILKL